MTQGITDFLRHDHKRCDELFVAAEQLAAERHCAEARAALAGFLAGMTRHFDMEEQVLFPAFEAATGIAMGPTAVMRHEHEQMRQLFGEMQQALATDNTDHFLGGAETLLILMQQHNAKEEQILYPMSDRSLADKMELIARMQAVS